jgi:hypothetical protein
VDSANACSVWKFAIVNWETSSVLCQVVSAFTSFLSSPVTHFIPGKEQCLLEFRENLNGDLDDPGDQPGKCVLLDLNSGKILDRFDLGGHLTPFVSLWGDILIAHHLPAAVNIYRRTDDTFVSTVTLDGKRMAADVKIKRVYTQLDGALCCVLVSPQTLSKGHVVFVGRVFGASAAEPHTIS